MTINNNRAWMSKPDDRPRVPAMIWSGRGDRQWLALAEDPTSQASAS